MNLFALFPRGMSALLPAMILIFLFTPLQGQGPNWVQVTRADGFNSTVLAVGHSGTLFIGTEKQGVFRSTDGGVSWRQFVSADNSKIDLLHVHTTGSLFAVAAGKLYRLRDSDGSLTSASPPLSFSDNRVTSLASDSTGGLLIGIGAGHMFRSRDDGESWNHLNSAGPLHKFDNRTPGTVTSISIGPAGEIYAALAIDWDNANSTVVLSTDGGVSFRDLDVTQPRTFLGTIILSTAVNSRGEVFGGTHAPNEGRRILARTSDKGKSWSTIGNLPVGQQVHNIVIDPRTDNILLPFSQTIYRSTDNGATFHPCAPQISTYGGTIRLASGPDKGVWAIERGSTVEHVLWRTLDGGSTWTEMHRGNFFDLFPPNISTFVSSAANRSNEYHVGYLGTKGNGMMRILHHQGLWPTPGLPIDTVISIAAGPGALVFTTDGRSVLRSTNWGNEWSIVDTARVSRSIRELGFVSGIVYMVTGDSVLFASHDSGVQWEQVGGMSGNPVRWISTYDDGWFFAGSSEGMWIKSPGSDIWRLTADRIDGGPPNSMAGNPKLRLVASNDRGVYISADSGSSWQLLGMADSAVIQVGILEQLVLARTASGIYGSNGTSDQWEPLHTGLPPGHITMMYTSHPGNRMLIAGIENIGLFFSLPAGTTSVPITGEPRINGKTLGISCIPNPATSNTTLRFTLAQREKLSVKAVDILGREAVITERWFEAGEKSIEWNVAGLAPGLYHVLVSSSNGSAAIGVIVR